MPSTGRTGRIVCFVLSILLLGTAVLLLTDAVQVDTEPEATKLIVLAQALATGSVTLMIGALVWTLAARNRSGNGGSGYGGSGQQGGSGYGGSGYGGSGYGGSGQHGGSRHSGPEHGVPGQVQSAPADAQPGWRPAEHQGTGHPPPGYGGGPAQEAWVPPPHDPHHPHGTASGHT